MITTPCVQKISGKVCTHNSVHMVLLLPNYLYNNTSLPETIMEIVKYASEYSV
jgi:hypothetical protein